MAAALMRMTKDGEQSAIDAVIVGADRVTANGDTANKIGTYSLVCCIVITTILHSLIINRQSLQDTTA